MWQRLKAWAETHPVLAIASAVGVVVLLGGGAAVVIRGGRKSLVKFTVKGGIVLETPEQIAAGLSKAVGHAVCVPCAVLAAALASEGGSESRAVRIAIGAAILNQARRTKGGDVVALITQGNGQSRGKLGAQNLGGRYCASSLPPSKEDLEIAEGLWHGTIADPTGGAVQWDSPRAQRALLARGTSGYTKTAEQVAASRMKEGKKLVVLAGVPEDEIRFWRWA